VNRREPSEYFTLPADQGFAFAQNNSGTYLWNNDVVSLNRREPSNYFIVAADQGLAFSQCIGCPTSCVAQRAMRESAPHARGVSKAR
jgi:hypothetical protein